MFHSFDSLGGREELPTFHISIKICDTLKWNKQEKQPLLQIQKLLIRMQYRYKGDNYLMSPCNIDTIQERDESILSANLSNY